MIKWVGGFLTFIYVAGAINISIVEMLDGETIVYAVNEGLLWPQRALRAFTHPAM